MNNFPFNLIERPRNVQQDLERLLNRKAIILPNQMLPQAPFGQRHCQNPRISVLPNVPDRQDIRHPLGIGCHQGLAIRTRNPVDELQGSSPLLSVLCGIDLAEAAFADTLTDSPRARFKFDDFTVRN